MKEILIFIPFVLLFQFSESNAQTRLLIRCDDTGMCHSVNLAVKQLIDADILFSTSVRFVCPWYKEAVDILKDHPEVAVGVHLTLNSEWKYYKWGPVLGREAVPSLVDSDGYFFYSEEAFRNAKINMDEVDKELRAQIDRAFKSGLRIDYLDAHMHMAFSTPELRTLVEKLARDYNLGISTYFGEFPETLWADPPESKYSVLLKYINSLQRDKLHLNVIHLGLENPEMDALVDMNNPVDPFRVSQHRQAELNALCSEGFKDAVQKKNIKLVTYRDVISELGLKAMERPSDHADY